MYRGSGGRMPFTAEREEPWMLGLGGEMGVEWKSLFVCGSKVKFSVASTRESRVYLSLDTVNVRIWKIQKAVAETHSIRGPQATKENRDRCFGCFGRRKRVRLRHTGGKEKGCTYVYVEKGEKNEDDHRREQNWKCREGESDSSTGQRTSCSEERPRK